MSSNPINSPGTPTISYRQLGPNSDPEFGQGSLNFLTDIYAVAQAILTRLRLFQGEWWEDLNDGTPVWQQILGVGNAQGRTQQISLILQQRVLGTPYVTGISNVQATFNSSTRAFSFYCIAYTPFGTVAISGPTTPGGGYGVGPLGARGYGE
jgi:hypothetical protein